jgi:hypothetical protein
LTRLASRGALIVTALLAFALILSANAALAADENQSVSVLRNDHVINFGENITFDLEISSVGAPIAEIQALFKPDGPRVVSSYSYPEFEPGNDVQATFEIPTTNGDFFPPGTVFTVSYLIVDSEGSEFTTDPVRIEYLDPQFDWNRRTDDRLTIVFHDRSESDIDRLFEAAAKRMPEIADVFGPPSEREFKAVIVNSGSEADSAFPRTTEAARAGHTFVGFAFDEYDEFVLWGVNRDSFVHELTHLMLAEAVSAPIANPPAWLNEGLAVYFESESGEAGNLRLRGARNEGDLMPIQNMNRVPGQRDDITFFYGKAGSFVEYLISEFGPSRMTALLDELNTGKSPADAVGLAYGFELDSLDAVWTAEKFGGPVPALVPVILDVPDDLADGVDDPADGPQVIASPVAAAELLFQTPPDEPSAWDDFGGWPVLFFGAGGIAAITYFGLRTLKRRGF